MPTTPSRGGGVSADTLYFTTEFSGDTELNTGRIYLGGTLVAKPSVWEELPEPELYKAVDLGLLSGLKWADRNIGAESPEAYGDYFAWGDTAPRGENWSADTPYDWAHCPFNDGSSSFDSGYFSTVSATVCPGGVLASEYDTATQIMGGSWRMPTSAEIQELIRGTTISVETLNGVKGIRFTSKVNGNSIFMPFAGYREGSEVYDGMGRYGFAWSSSLNAGNAYYSHYIDFNSRVSGRVSVNYNTRYDGFAVRGVCQ